MVAVPSSSVLSDFVNPRTVACQAPLSMGFSRQPKGRGVGCHFLLLGIFLTQGSNPYPLHCRQILYHGATWEGLRMIMCKQWVSADRLSPISLWVHFRAILSSAWSSWWRTPTGHREGNRSEPFEGRWDQKPIYAISTDAYRVSTRCLIICAVLGIGSVRINMTALAVRSWNCSLVEKTEKHIIL